MGNYINIGNTGFQSVRNGEYVDKSGLIAIVNSLLFTERRFSCVSRSRRFGKSVAAKMLCAYYDQSCDSRELFADLKIAQDPSFEKHLNKYPVIYLDLTSLISAMKDEGIVNRIDTELLADISTAYADIPVEAGDDLMKYLLRVTEATKQQFIFIIDEWDAICREYAPGSEVMDRYVGWLRRMFKSIDGTRVFAAVYMTGILPIKKYQTESALNNFQEYSMVIPRRMAGFFGFTKPEVMALAEKYGADYDELEKWYDGYQIGNEKSIFNPNSVMQAIWANCCSNNWWGTSSIHAFDNCISNNFDGILDEFTKLFKGIHIIINKNRLCHYRWGKMKVKDDVLAALIHFGYLSYDRKLGECYIPNKETLGRFSSYVSSLTTCCSSALTTTAINTKQHSCKIEKLKS